MQTCEQRCPSEGVCAPNCKDGARRISHASFWGKSDKSAGPAAPRITGKKQSLSSSWACLWHHREAHIPCAVVRMAARLPFAATHGNAYHACAPFPIPSAERQRQCSIPQLARIPIGRSRLTCNGREQRDKRKAVKKGKGKGKGESSDWREGSAFSFASHRIPSPIPHPQNHPPLTTSGTWASGCP